MADTIRIGIVGAGANTRLRHIPGFRGLEDVEIVGVCNRSEETSKKVADEFHIPRTYSRWEDLVADPDVDAVMIGTWPNMHCEVTCTALDAGKHVLCEARMARNLAEARQMLAASGAHPQLTAQIVPSPFGLEVGPAVEYMIRDHFLGDFRELIVIGADDVFWDYSKPMHWRQDAEISGVNVLMLGILHETAMRWAPQPQRVYAHTVLFEATRPVPSSHEYAEVTVPDCVHATAELQGGGLGLYHFSGTALYGPGKQIHMYGSRGTIRVEFDPEERVFIGRAGEGELKEIDIPPEQSGSWRVEEEFINAIRGKEKVKLTDFKTAVSYMEFTEAVARSAATGEAIDLPLTDDA